MGKGWTKARGGYENANTKLSGCYLNWYLSMQNSAECVIFDDTITTNSQPPANASLKRESGNAPERYSKLSLIASAITGKVYRTLK